MTQLEQTDEWFRVIERYLLEKTFTARDACWRIEETIALLPPECDPVPYRYVRQNLLDEEAYYHGLLNESIQACRRFPMFSQTSRRVSTRNG